MKLKVTNNITYLEAKKLHENKPETTFSKIVQSIARPEMKDASTQYKVKDYKSRKENPQKPTQLSSRSHPRHLVGKRTAQKTPS